jgi:phosphoribosylaminoimidazole carboxylase/phosphoribosylaminoimidazole-succinocarboxamide synthase
VPTVTLIEGKTKIITASGATKKIVRITSKDDITAGNGVRHDVMRGKGILSTTTTCNVFELLRKHGLPLAYLRRVRPKVFLAHNCEMIPVEVVVRGVATGSYLKRHPEIKNGHRFDQPIVEFFYKTTGRQIGDVTLPQDDPLLRSDSHGYWWLYEDKEQLHRGYIGPLPVSDTIQKQLTARLAICEKIAIDAFLVLQEAWRSVDGDLWDFKLEFGLLPDGTIVIADVIDCDSWRVLWKGVQLSKEPYRNGMSIPNSRQPDRRHVA